MKEEKLEQLRTVFRMIIEKVISNTTTRQEYFRTDDYIQKIVDELIYEVKIRINNN